MKLEKSKSWREEVVAEIMSIDVENIHCLLKVKSKNYVPPTIVLRSRIDEYIFSADVTKDSIDTILNDQKIKFIEVSNEYRELGEMD